MKAAIWHKLIIIAVFVVVFLAIHPFQDGNGRLSRILTTLLLLRACISPFRQSWRLPGVLVDFFGEEIADIRAPFASVVNYVVVTWPVSKGGAGRNGEPGRGRRGAAA